MPTTLYPDMRYESNDGTCSFVGTWTQNVSDNSLRNNTKSATTVTTGDYMTVTPTVAFTDAVLHLYGNGDAGKVRVYVDNVAYGDYDCFMFNTNIASNPGYNTPIIYLTGLTNAAHVVKVECLGTNGSGSSGVKVGFNHIVCLSTSLPINYKVPKRVLFIGDSITDNSTGFATTTVPALSESLRPGSKMSWRWQTRPGVGSDIARFAKNSIIANRPSLVSVMLGTNDLGTSFYSLTISNIQIVIDVCKSLGVAVQICTIPPRNNITAFYYLDLNEKIRELARVNGVPLIDWKPVFNDVAGTTGLFNSDGVHPSPVGQFMMGKFMFDKMTHKSHPFYEMLTKE